MAADRVCSRIGGEIREEFKLEDLGLAIQVKCSLSKSFEESSRSLNVTLLGREFSPLSYAYAKDVCEKKISSAKMLNDSIMRRAVAELYTDRRELHKLVLASLLRVPVILFR